jgi:hypothetical protein
MERSDVTIILPEEDWVCRMMKAMFSLHVGQVMGRAKIDGVGTYRRVSRASVLLLMMICCWEDSCSTHHGRAAEGHIIAVQEGRQSYWFDGKNWTVEMM